MVVIGLRSDLSEAQTAAFTDSLSDALSAEARLKVTSAESLRTLLGLERQRQLLGCSEGVSCLTEIAAALGPQVVVSGSITRAGSRFLVMVRALGGRDGRTLFSEQNVLEDEVSVLAWFRRVAGPMADALAPRPSSALAVASGVTLGVGVAAAVTLFILSALQHTSFLAAPSLADAQPYARNGTLFQALGFAGAGVAALGAVGLTVSLVTAPPAASTSLVAGSPAGAVLSWRMTW